MIRFSFRSWSLSLWLGALLVTAVTLLPAARAEAAQVPFTGLLKIDFTANGGTSISIPGTGMATVNGTGSPSIIISKLTIPASGFFGSGAAFVDGPSTIPAQFVIFGSTIKNASIFLSQGASCTATHPNVSCAGGGLAGLGAISGPKASFLFGFSGVGSLSPHRQHRDGLRCNRHLRHTRRNSFGQRAGPRVRSPLRERLSPAVSFRSAPTPQSTWCRPLRSSRSVLEAVARASHALPCSSRI